VCVVRRVHELSSIGRLELLRSKRLLNEGIILAHLDRPEVILLPPIAPVAKRCTQCVVTFAAVLPPGKAVCKAHRVVTRNGLLRFHKSSNLVHQAARRREIIIVPMADNIARCPLTSEISFLSDRSALCQMKEPNASVNRKKIPNVRAVGQDQKLSVPVRLILKALDRRW
jgi:hypothetical protein